MHLTLRRYADPLRHFGRFFGLGVLAGALGLAIVVERIGASETDAGDHSDRIARAQKTVEQYAYEAFPGWAVDHPDLACPTDRSQLDVYVGGSSGFDPWGHRYAVACDAGGRLVAWSVGPDGVDGSADDVRSR
jgi:hypothetical protein